MHMLFICTSPIQCQHFDIDTNRNVFEEKIMKFPITKKYMYNNSRYIAVPIQHQFEGDMTQHDCQE